MLYPVIRSPLNGDHHARSLRSLKTQRLEDLIFAHFAALRELIPSNALRYLFNRRIYENQIPYA